jgi:hypothetical protein
MEFSRSCNRTSARRHIRLAQLRSEEPKDLVHAARAGPTEADGAIEGVLAQSDGAAVAATHEVDRSDQVHPMEWSVARACRPGYSWRGSSGATRTRCAVKPLRSRTRSMARPQASGQTPWAFSSARMGVAPIKQSRAAGAACASSRRRIERMARSNSGGIR